MRLLHVVDRASGVTTRAEGSNALLALKGRVSLLGSNQFVEILHRPWENSPQPSGRSGGSKADCHKPVPQFVTQFVRVEGDRIVAKSPVPLRGNSRRARKVQPRRGERNEVAPDVVVLEQHANGQRRSRHPVRKTGSPNFRWCGPTAASTTAQSMSRRCRTQRSTPSYPSRAHSNARVGTTDRSCRPREHPASLDSPSPSRGTNRPRAGSCGSAASRRCRGGRTEATRARVVSDTPRGRTALGRIGHIERVFDERLPATTGRGSLGQQRGHDVLGTWGKKNPRPNLVRPPRPHSWRRINSSAVSAETTSA